MISKILKARYKTLKTLATSNMSETYLAEDLENNRLCVVKRLQSADPSFFSDAQRLFNEEAKILGKLGNYDQIPQLFDFFTEDREFYLVQEYIEGHLLSHELLGKPWSEVKVWQFLQEALKILDRVHQQGVIHRDIKPSNLMRRKQDGNLVLIDFGAVKQVQILDFEPANTPTIPFRLAYPSSQPVEVMVNTVAIGTPGYMPLEQYRGKPRLSSDLYALGMVAIQALTGLSPRQLPEDEDGEIIWQDRVKVNPELATFLTKMVHSHFRERYQNAGEALNALQAIKPLPVTSPVNTVVVEPQKVHIQKKSHHQPLLWFINCIGIVGVCFIFLKITKNHQYNEVQQKIKEAKSFLNNHQYLLDKWEKEWNDSQAQFQEVKSAIEQYNWLQAEKVASNIQHIYWQKEAKQTIKQKYENILQTAETQYRDGDLRKAIDITDSLSSTANVYSQAQKLKAQWQEELKQIELEIKDFFEFYFYTINHGWYQETWQQHTDYSQQTVKGGYKSFVNYWEPVLIELKKVELTKIDKNNQLANVRVIVENRGVPLDKASQYYQDFSKCLRQNSNFNNFKIEDKSFCK